MYIKSLGSFKKYNHSIIEINRLDGKTERKFGGIKSPAFTHDVSIEVEGDEELTLETLIRVLIEFKTLNGV